MGGRRIEAVDLSAKRPIVLAAREAPNDGGVQAPEYIANLAGFRIDQDKHDGKLRVWREGPDTEFPSVAAFLVGKTAGFDLREARRPNPVPAIGAVNTVSVDQRNPGDQPTAAFDDDGLATRQLAEPADFGTLKFCQSRASSRWAA